MVCKYQSILFLTELAFSPNDHTVHIYKLAGKKWQPECILTEVR